MTECLFCFVIVVCGPLIDIRSAECRQRADCACAGPFVRRKSENLGPRTGGQRHHIGKSALRRLIRKPEILFGDKACRASSQAGPVTGTNDDETAEGPLVNIGSLQELFETGLKVVQRNQALLAGSRSRMVAEDCSSSSSPMITAARASILLARFMRCFIFPRYPKSTEIPALRSRFVSMEISSAASPTG